MSQSQRICNGCNLWRPDGWPGDSDSEFAGQWFCTDCWQPYLDKGEAEKQAAKLKEKELASKQQADDLFAIHARSIAGMPRNAMMPNSSITSTNPVTLSHQSWSTNSCLRTPKFDNPQESFSMFGVHQDWKDVMHFYPQGAFFRQKACDKGAWFVQRGNLELRWDKWKPDTLSTEDGGWTFINNELEISARSRKPPVWWLTLFIEKDDADSKDELDDFLRGELEDDSEKSDEKCCEEATEATGELEDDSEKSDEKCCEEATEADSSTAYQSMATTVDERAESYTTTDTRDTPANIDSHDDDDDEDPDIQFNVAINVDSYMKEIFGDEEDEEDTFHQLGVCNSECCDFVSFGDDQGLKSLPESKLHEIATARGITGCHNLTVDDIAEILHWIDVLRSSAISNNLQLFQDHFGKLAGRLDPTCLQCVLNAPESDNCAGPILDTCLKHQGKDSLQTLEAPLNYVLSSPEFSREEHLYEIVELLLKGKAMPDKDGNSTDEMFRPLESLTKGTEITELLVQHHANIPWHPSSLQACVRSGYIRGVHEALELLGPHAHEVLQRPDYRSDGSYVLHCCAAKCCDSRMYSEIVTKLVCHKASVNALDAQSRTPLSVAVATFLADTDPRDLTQAKLYGLRTIRALLQPGMTGEWYLQWQSDRCSLAEIVGSNAGERLTQLLLDYGADLPWHPKSLQGALRSHNVQGVHEALHRLKLRNNVHAILNHRDNRSLLHKSATSCNAGAAEINKLLIEHSADVFSTAFMDMDVADNDVAGAGAGAGAAGSGEDADDETGAVEVDVKSQAKQLPLAALGSEGVKCATEEVELQGKHEAVQLTAAEHAAEGINLPTEPTAPAPAPASTPAPSPAPEALPAVPAAPAPLAPGALGDRAPAPKTASASVPAPSAADSTNSISINKYPQPAPSAADSTLSSTQHPQPAPASSASASAPTPAPTTASADLGHGCSNENGGSSPQAGGRRMLQARCHRIQPRQRECKESLEDEPSPNKNISELVVSSLRRNTAPKVRKAVMHSCATDNPDHVSCPKWMRHMSTPAKSLLHCVKTNDLEGVREALGAGKCTVTMPQDAGCTLLHICSESAGLGQADRIAQYLIDFACDVNAKDDLGRVPVQIAVPAIIGRSGKESESASSMHFLKLLLDARAAVQTLGEWNLHESVLAKAANTEAGLAVSQLLVEAGAIMPWHDTSLQSCVEACDVNGVITVLERLGPYASSRIRDEGKPSLLHISAANALKDDAGQVVRLLLRHSAAVNNPDASGRLPISIAVSSSIARSRLHFRSHVPIDTVKAFLEGGATVSFVQDWYSSDCALAKAVNTPGKSIGNEIAKLLLAHGAKLPWHRSSLQSCVKNCDLQGVDKALERLGSKSSLHLETQEESDDTLLHECMKHAAREGAADIARRLIALDARVNSQNSAGETPLAVAVSASLECRDSSFEQVSHNTITTLLQASADPNLVQEWQSPDCALALRGTQSLLELLQSFGLKVKWWKEVMTRLKYSIQPEALDVSAAHALGIEIRELGQQGDEELEELCRNRNMEVPKSSAECIKALGLILTIEKQEAALNSNNCAPWLGIWCYRYLVGSKGDKRWNKQFSLYLDDNGNLIYKESRSFDDLRGVLQVQADGSRLATLLSAYDNKLEFGQIRLRFNEEELTIQTTFKSEASKAWGPEFYALKSVTNFQQLKEYWPTNN